MNRLMISLILVGLTLASGAGLYFMIQKNGKLSEENKNLTATIEDTQTAILDLGITITELQTKYEKAGDNEEFKKFNKMDISKIPMSKLVNDYNDGVRRVLEDYQNRTTQFVGPNP